jgi:hypothetical protein
LVFANVPFTRALFKNAMLLCRPIVEITYYTSPKMYTICRSCWITVIVLPTHVFGEARIETSKIHNLFIQYPNNTYFSILKSS